MSSQESRSRLGAAAVLALAALSGAVASGCTRAEPPAFERPPAPVVVAPAVAEDVPVYLDEVGKAVAREVVEVRPQVSGRITQIHFADGADLKEGDPLITIDPRPFQARLDAAEAALAEARADRGLAEAEFARVSALIETKAISRSEFDVKKSGIEVSAARVRLAEAAVEITRIDLEYCSIRAPFEGRAGQRLVDAGNVVAPSGGPLLVVQRLDPVYAEFTVTERDLAAVQRGLARGTLRAEVRLPDGDDTPRTGEVTFLDNAVSGDTGTVKLRATVPNSDRRFWPGGFLRVRLVLDTLRGAVLVPAAAVQTSAKGPFAYVVKEDLTAELRPLAIGQRHGERVVVAEGLRAGERVVLEGHIAVMPGGKVRIDVPVASASSPGGPGEGDGAR